MEVRRIQYLTFLYHFCFCSILCRPPYAGLSLDIRRRNIAKGARPCLCHAAPPTAVGGAHNSPIANARHDIEGLVSPLRVTSIYIIQSRCLSVCVTVTVR